MYQYQYQHQRIKTLVNPSYSTPRKRIKSLQTNISNFDYYSNNSFQPITTDSTRLVNLSDNQSYNHLIEFPQVKKYPKIKRYLEDKQHFFQQLSLKHNTNQKQKQTENNRRNAMEIFNLKKDVQQPINHFILKQLQQQGKNVRLQKLWDKYHYNKKQSSPDYIQLPFKTKYEKILSTQLLLIESSKLSSENYKQLRSNFKSIYQNLVIN